MEVVAFYGPPGTGKSDRALVIAYENQCSCIIDDGILIYHNRIVAGKSAKREESRLKAVRRAIFWDEEQREDVKKTLQKIHPDCILICDEIGNGIVPMEAEERIYRERTGRILEQLAAQADEVVRVVCGIGQKIK